MNITHEILGNCSNDKHTADVAERRANKINTIATQGRETVRQDPLEKPEMGGGKGNLVLKFPFINLLRAPDQSGCSRKQVL